MILWLVLAALIASDVAAADSEAAIPKNTAQSPSPVNNPSVAKLENSSTTETKAVASTDTATTEQPGGVFPHLERALIIVTIVNLLVIIGGLATYLLKRRMQQFLPVQMARMNQER